MSGPITWRNVSGPSVAAAAQPLALAGNTFNNAFEGLSKMLQQRQAVNQGVEDRAEADRLVTAQELLYGAKTPEEVAAATQQISALKKGLNAKSRTALLGAEDKRVNEVNDNFTKTLAAKNVRTDAEQAATVQQVKQLQAEGKVEEANALAATLRTGGDLALSGRVISREDAKTALDKRKVEQEISASQSGVINAQGTLKVAEGNLAVNQAQANNTKAYQDAQITLQKLGVQQNLLSNLEKSLGSAGSGGSGSGKTSGSEGIGNLVDTAKSVGIEGKNLTSLTTKVAELRKDPKYAKIPEDRLTSIALAGDLNPWFSSNIGGDIKGRADAYLASPEYLKDLSNAETTKAENALRKQLVRRVEDQVMVGAGVLPRLPDYGNAEQPSTGGSTKGSGLINKATGVPYDGDSRYSVLLAASSDNRIDQSLVEEASNLIDNGTPAEWDKLYKKAGITNDTKYEDWVPPKGTRSGNDSISRVSSSLETKGKDNAYSNLESLERAEIAAGIRKEFSADLKAHLTEEKRKAVNQFLTDFGTSFVDGSKQLLAAGADIVTLPVRGVGGALNSVSEGLNTLGLGTPYYDYAESFDSMTPYSDRLLRDKTKASSEAELKRMRKEVERELNKHRK